MQHLIKVVFMLAIFVPTDGLAHPFYASDGGFVATFLHPFSGLDHLLAMLTVGILAVCNINRAAPWCWPASFLSMAAVGFCLGPLVGNTALVELTVAVSVVVLGLMLASRWHGSLVWLLLIAVFGLMHGLAHAVELNPNAGFVACFSGFLVATSLLHTAGMGLAFMLRRPLQIRLCGVMIAVFGLFGLVL